jgi:limonene-1,2-epoxide hydrolase
VTSPIERLRALMAVSKARDKPAFLAFFAPEIEYHYHVGTRPLVGVDWVDRFITRYWANHSETEWVLTNWAENENKVLTEGREDYVNADGVKVSHPYMGIIEFADDGRITAWRDYFQMKDPAATG